MIYWQKYLDTRAFLPRQINEIPDMDLQLIIVMPVKNEPDISGVIHSLSNCAVPQAGIELIIVVNHEEYSLASVVKQNEKTVHEIGELLTPDWLKVFTIKAFDLPKKKSGVGLARKIGMDEAVRRFLYIENENGIIACLDADCTVSENYLGGIIDFFDSHQGVEAASIYFEHPLELTPECQREYVAAYELHLRYFIAAQKFAGFPLAFQTIGSSMAVSAAGYVAQGGMNTRKAGEDFYFLHKFSEIGKLVNLNDIAVYPSGRISDRVPFGTGKAVSAQVDKGEVRLTYNFQSFVDLKEMIQKIPLLHNQDPSSFISAIPECPQEFLIDHVKDVIVLLQAIKRNTTTIKMMTKRFFRFFNAFMLMKYLHFARDNYYPDQPIINEVNKLNSKLVSKTVINNIENALHVFRQMDRYSS